MELREKERVEHEDKPSLPRRECAPPQAPKGPSRGGRRRATACRPRLRDIGKAASSDAQIRGHQEKRSRNHARLMRLATIAAPKPLSMFTTVTLEAQLFNILSNAVNPPKLDP